MWHQGDIVCSPDVESFVCFPERFKFYDHYGRPHTERIKALLGDDMKVCFH